jgi:hypothetical protein
VPKESEREREKLDFSHLKSLAIDLKAIFVLNNDLKIILALSELCLKEILNFFIKILN